MPPAFTACVKEPEFFLCGLKRWYGHGLCLADVLLIPAGVISDFCHFTSSYLSSCEGDIWRSRFVVAMRNSGYIF